VSVSSGGFTDLKVVSYENIIHTLPFFLPPGSFKPNVKAKQIEAYGLSSHKDENVILCQRRATISRNKCGRLETRILKSEHTVLQVSRHNTIIYCKFASVSIKYITVKCMHIPV